MEPIPAGSKKDTLQTKDKPIRDSSEASGKTDLRRQGTIAIATRDQSESIWKEQIWKLQDQWNRRERRCSRHQSKDSLAAHDEDHTKAAVPMQTMEVHSGQRSSFSPWKTPLWSKFITKGSFDHVEAFFAGAGLLVAGPVTLQEIHSGEVCPWRAAPCGKGPGVVNVELQFGGKTRTGEVHGGLFSSMGHIQCWGSTEMWAAQYSCMQNWLQCPSSPSVPLHGRT